jgi:osmotically-inducible protein OsmY
MPSAIAERPTIAATTHTDLSGAARNHLEAHPHFRGRLTDVVIMHEGKTVTLRGRLPSFYLKQLVQEAVRHVPGVQRVRNMIDVVSADGVSSVRC